MHKKSPSVTLIIALLFFSFRSLAQNTFPCDGKLYYFGDSSGVAMLSYVENYTSIPVSVNVCPLPTASHNGLGANPVDHFLYYLNGSTLQKLDAACNTSVVCTLPGSSTKGCFDNKGRYWFDANGLQAMDINTCSIVAGPFAALPSGTSVDLTFNPYDCHFYVASSSLTYKIDTLGNIVATIPGGFGVGGTIGGIALGEDGKIYGMPNNTSSVSMYAIDLSTGLSNLVTTFSSGTALSGGADMASFLCNQVTALATADVDSGCPGITVNFTNLSAGIGNDIHWYFDDPSSGNSDTSSLANPSHTFSSTGTHFVTLFVNSNVTTQCVPLGADSIIIPIVIDAPNINLAADTSICIGDSMMLNATGNGVFQWTSTGMLSCTTCPNPIVSPADTTTYYLTLTDAVLGCQNSDSIKVNVNTPPAAPNIYINAQLPICAGDSILLNASGTGSFQWLPANSVSCNTCDSTLVFPSDSTYFTLRLTNAFTGCSAKDSILIPVLNAPSLSLSNNVAICIGDTASLIASGSGNFLWLPNLGLNCDTCLTVLAHPLVTTTYYLTLTDTIAGCQNSDSVVVTVNTLPILTLSNDTTVCEGSTLNLSASASGNIIFTWVPNTGLSCSNCPNPTATLADSIIYNVMALNATTGCMYHDNITINTIPIPNVIINSDSIVCLGDSLQLTAVGANNYLWSTGSNSAFIYVTPNQQSTYEVTGFNGLCSVSVQKNISVISINPPIASDTTICKDAQIILAVNGSTNVEWYFSETDITPFYRGLTYQTDALSEATTFYLLSNDGLCKSDYRTINILVQECPTLVPNIFTPNGDGTNDIFYIETEHFVDAKVKIYNRWGILIYEWIGMNGGWNGKINGDATDANAGVYYYLAELMDSKGISTLKQGFVELIR